jgi:hypothetical protein
MGLAATLVLVAPAAYALQAAIGIAAAATAALVCLIASVMAALAGGIVSRRGHVLAATLLPMLVRMALPLTFCAAAQFWRGPLVESGLALYVVGFYVLTLAIDTWLSVGRPPIGTGASREL